MAAACPGADLCCWGKAFRALWFCALAYVGWVGRFLSGLGYKRGFVGLWHG
jgi:hypothetical protein